MVDDWRGSEREPSRRALSRRSSLVASSIAAAIGALALIGHTLGTRSLVHFPRSGLAMTIETAIEFCVLGAALIWWLVGSSRQRHIVITVAGVLMALYSLVKLVIYATGADIDLAVGTLPGPDGRVAAMQSAHTAALFLMYGVALAVLPWRSLRTVRTLLIALSSATVLVATFGLIYHVTYLYRESGIIGMAVHTLIAFVAVNTSFFCIRPDEGLVRILNADTSGGLLARRLIPAALLIPFIIAVVVSQFRDTDGRASAESLLVVTSATVLMVIALAIFSSVQMHRHDLERRDLMERLQSLADLDSMTGLVNRRVFATELAGSLQRAGRRDDGVAVVMVDLDGLKPANDMYGHSVGDQLIRGVADLLVHRVRQSDVVARLGGDEFGILLAPVDPEIAERLVGRIVASVAGASFGHDGTAVRSTISAGVAHCWRGELSADEMLQLADAAMYQAKTAGGNDYAWGTPPPKGERTPMDHHPLDHHPVPTGTSANLDK